MEKGAWDGKARGAMAFALNFLWLLSLFQDKESDKSKIQSNSCKKNRFQNHLLVSNFLTPEHRYHVIDNNGYFFCRLIIKNDRWIFL
jgi:hypothetical protein